MHRRDFLLTSGLSVVATAAGSWRARAAAQGPGVTATEIRIGQTVAYSGSASAYAPWGLAQKAYFTWVNANGGINGRKINFISLDDAGSPAKTVEQVRKLVESDEVLAVFGSLGAQGINATKKYLEAREVPQLFLGIGANVWGPPPAFRLATMWSPDHRTETRAYVRDILANNSAARIAVLTQDDDTGRNQLAGLKEALGGDARQVVAEATYQLTDPSVESQVLKLKSSGADAFVNLGSPKFAAQAIKRAAETGWKPAQYIFSFSSSIKGTLEPAGIQNAIGIKTATYLKDPADPAMKEDVGVKEYLAWNAKHYAASDPLNVLNIQGYSAAQLLVEILRRCGEDLSRANLIKQAKSIKGLQLPMLLDGVTINTTPDDPSGIHIMKLQRFDGGRWKLVGS